MLIIAAGISSVIGMNSIDVGKTDPTTAPSPAIENRIANHERASVRSTFPNAIGSSITISEVTASKIVSRDEFPAERPNSSVSKNRTMAVSIEKWFVVVVSFCVIALSLVKNSSFN